MYIYTHNYIYTICMHMCITTHIHTQNGIVFSHGKKENPVICNNMNGEGALY